MADLVYPNGYGFVAGEISACLRIDCNPALEIKPAWKLRSRDDGTISHQRFGPLHNGYRT